MWFHIPSLAPCQSNIIQDCVKRPMESNDNIQQYSWIFMANLDASNGSVYISCLFHVWVPWRFREITEPLLAQSAPSIPCADVKKRLGRFLHHLSQRTHHVPRATCDHCSHCRAAFSAQLFPLHNWNLFGASYFPHLPISYYLSLLPILILSLSIFLLSISFLPNLSSEQPSVISLKAAALLFTARVSGKPWDDNFCVPHPTYMFINSSMKYSEIAAKRMAKVYLQFWSVQNHWRLNLDYDWISTAFRYSLGIRTRQWQRIDEEGTKWPLASAEGIKMKAPRFQKGKRQHCGSWRNGLGMKSIASLWSRHPKKRGTSAADESPVILVPCHVWSTELQTQGDWRTCTPSKWRGLLRKAVKRGERSCEKDTIWMETWSLGKIVAVDLCLSSFCTDCIGDL